MATLCVSKPHLGVGSKHARFADCQISPGIPKIDEPYVEDLRAEVQATKDVLANIKLKEVIQESQEIVLLEHNMTVAQSLRLFAKHKILSAPMVVKPGVEDLDSFLPQLSAPSLLGWLDVGDIMKEFLHQVHQQHPQLPNNVLQLLKILEDEGQTFGAKSLVTLIDSQDMQLLFQPDANTSLLKAVTDMFLNTGGNNRIVHRLAIFNSLGDIVSIVSHLDVVCYLHQHSYLLAPLADKTLLELGLCTTRTRVVSVDANMPTILAYEVLMKEKVRGAAVVSEDNKLVANLSISDLRSIQPEHLGVLALPVGEFLAVLHGTAYLGYSQKASGSASHPFFGHDGDPAHMTTLHQPITCTAQNTLLEVLGMMADNRVHRVFVMSPNNARIVDAILTPSDLMAVICGMDPPVMRRCEAVC